MCFRREVKDKAVPAILFVQTIVEARLPRAVNGLTDVMDTPVAGLQWRAFFLFLSLVFFCRLSEKEGVILGVVFVYEQYTRDHEAMQTALTLQQAVAK